MEGVVGEVVLVAADGSMPGNRWAGSEPIGAGDAVGAGDEIAAKAEALVAEIAVMLGRRSRRGSRCWAWGRRCPGGRRRRRFQSRGASRRR